MQFELVKNSAHQKSKRADNLHVVVCGGISKMSTEDLHTSSDPTQSGKVVQLNGDCTSQITLPMSHTLTMWGRVGPAEGIKHYKH